MKSVIRQIVEFMGKRHDAAEHELLSEWDIAGELELNVDDVRIAVGMMGDQGLLATKDHQGKAVLELSAKGIQEYRSYLANP